MYKIILIVYLSTINLTSGSRNISGICLHGNLPKTVQELKKDSQVLLKNIAIYKDVVKMNKQLKNDIKWILEETRGEKEISRIVSLLKNEFKDIAIYKDVVEMNKQLKNDIKWILEETRGEKEISRIVSLLKNEFKGTCAKPAKDCTELEKYNKKSGVYKISPGNSKDLKVYCDMTTDGGGWSIIQRHYDGTVDFQQTWAEYENGFGNAEGEYWLGNKYIHHMTSSGHYELRIDLTDNKNEKKYAVYKQFSIGDAASKYKLSVRSYSGNASDSMKYQNGLMFSATDQDNDKSSSDCAKGGGPWWHANCTWSALNKKFSSNLYWHTFPNHTAKTSIMMIRRI